MFMSTNYCVIGSFKNIYVNIFYKTQIRLKKEWNKHRVCCEPLPVMATGYNFTQTHSGTLAMVTVQTSSSNCGS